MSETTNKFSTEVRARAVRMVLDHEGDHSSRWLAIVSVSGKIDCVLQTLFEWKMGLNQIASRLSAFAKADPLSWKLPRLLQYLSQESQFLESSIRMTGD